MRFLLFPFQILERIEPCSQLSKGNQSEQSTKVALPAAIPIPKADFPTPKVDETNPAEVTALNMEVETLKWQLAQVFIVNIISSFITYFIRCVIKFYNNGYLLKN